ncbi:MAG: patatin-like phospholipase family protein [Caulobacteraceae bacterium]|nr:patatin-like phospholipase family protein [Caulobacteraceae bacterium]
MTRALVLGGGGPVGIAWEAGLLAGLARGGVDLGAADFIVGTSAGSFVGSQLAMGRKAEDLAAAILAEADHPRAPSGEPRRPPPDVTWLFAKMQEAREGRRAPKEVRAEIGALAMAAETVDEEAFIKSFGRSLSELPEDAWPTRGFACTAVDAQTGEFVLWDAAAKVGLARAVASSCSVPGIFPPITLKGRPYIDGGMRSATNADVAKGHDVIVVVALRMAGGSNPVQEATRAQLDAEMAVLRENGGRAELILPDEASTTAFGPNLMDARRRPDAARAGLAQGEAMAASLREVWG